MILNKILTCDVEVVHVLVLTIEGNVCQVADRSLCHYVAKQLIFTNRTRRWQKQTTLEGTKASVGTAAYNSARIFINTDQTLEMLFPQS